LLLDMCFGTMEDSEYQCRNFFSRSRISEHTFQVAERVAIMYSGRLVEVGDVVQIFQNPKHPYTKGLMSSFPRIVIMQQSSRKARPKLRGIPRSPPDSRNIPTGCSFHLRSPHSKNKCIDLRPELHKTSPTHKIACHYFE
jgi:oligopeptide/dipeptide ABC transporter ATP-binding protein